MPRAAQGRSPRCGQAVCWYCSEFLVVSRIFSIFSSSRSVSVWRCSEGAAQGSKLVWRRQASAARAAQGALRPCAARPPPFRPQKRGAGRFPAPLARCPGLRRGVGAMVAQLPFGGAVAGRLSSRAMDAAQGGVLLALGAGVQGNKPYGLQRCKSLAAA